MIDKCTVCNNKKWDSYWAMKGYNLLKCRECGMVWDPYPMENLLSQYDKTYFKNEDPKGGYANYFEGMSINKRTFSERLKKIEREVGKGKLLDVGCALGDCLLGAKRLGWEDAIGVEVSDYAFKFAKKRDLKVIKGTLREIEFKKNSFDLVLYQDVIEHISDPIKEMKRVNEMLKLGGYVFLVTPDIGGIQAKLLGSHWYHYKPNEHVSYFSEKSIKELLKETGFENIKVKPAYHVMSFEYILNRLRYYLPVIFGILLRLVQRTIFLKKLLFRAYIGEMEVWGQKKR